MIAHVFPHLRREDTAERAPSPADLRALTVRQPWAACIASGAKTVENRTWPTKYRGPLLIHAAQAVDTDALGISAFREHMWRALATDPTAAHVCGAVVAIARLVDCHLEDHQACCAPWGETGRGVWHWTLQDVHKLKEPVECAGRLSVWRPRPEIVAAVLAQIGGAS